MFWPNSDTSLARKNLRQALSSLRHVLEPAPMPLGSVLLSKHDSVQLNPEAINTDVFKFEQLIRESRKEEQGALLSQAVQLYKGDLLPGFNDDWIWSERIRLEDLYLSALSRLSEIEPPDVAIGHLRTAVSREPFNEEWHIRLIERYLQIGRAQRAVDQFNELENALRDNFGQRPSANSRALFERARQLLGDPVPLIQAQDRIPATSKPPTPIVRLPFVADRYFGRTDEAHLVCSQLENGSSRLVTIMGPAGVGKTRLSIECAKLLSQRQSWNIWFVPLAERFNASEIYEVIIAAMDPQHRVSSSELSRIGELTGGQPTLLVLDNLEQIADHAGSYVARLLAENPNISCLASSRQPLQIAAERVVPIEPLPLPQLGVTELAQLVEFSSIQLFLDRCQSIRPDLQLNVRNASAIASLCIQLDGVPLALEIAAGLSNNFSPNQMLNNLPVRQTELASRRRDKPERHRSLRAAIDWSYDILSPDLQKLFLRFSVFRGGFTLDAAWKVCAYEWSEELDSLGACIEAIRSLQEKSLVRSQAEQSEQEPYYSMLTAFREYAEDHLSADELVLLRDRHAQYFASKAAPDRPFSCVKEQTALHLSVERNVDNFTSAIEFSLSKGNLERCILLLGILSIRWLVRGPTIIERRLIRDIANQSGLSQLSAPLRVQFQRMLGTTYIRSGDYEQAYDACSLAVEVAKREGDDTLLATCFSGLSICAGYLGRLEESLSLNERVLSLVGRDNLSLTERSYLGIGSVLWNEGRLAEASNAFDRARTVSVNLRGGEPDVLIVINQARVALDLGRHKESFRLAHEAIRISRRLQDDFSLAVVLTVVSRYHQVVGNFEAALATNLEALEKCQQGDFLFWILQCLRNHALIWVDMGQYQEATTLLAATHETFDSQRSIDKGDVDRALDTIRAAIPKAQFEASWAKGLAMGRQEAIRFVVASKVVDVL